MNFNIKSGSKAFVAFALFTVTSVYAEPKSWLAPPNEDVRLNESPSSWPQIQGKNRLHLLECQRSNAMKSLENKKFVELNLKQVSLLTGKSEKRPGNYYLIRSLRFTDGTAGFFLGWKNQQLWSHAGVLGSNPH